MAKFQLVDDGTMDTVIRCSDCGEEFRFNYDGGITLNDATTESPEQQYDDFVEWAIEEVKSDHECK